MRRQDYERPAFGFTRYCLFSVVFVKYHGRTSVHRFVHDLVNRRVSKEYTDNLGTGGPHSRFVLDFLVEDWKMRGDFFFLFNTPAHCSDHYDVVSAENLDLLGNQTGRTDELRQYLSGIVAANPDIAAVHYVPPVPTEGINLSIAFAFRKTGRQYPNVVREILDSKPQIQAYMYNILAVLEGNELVNESMRTAVGAIIGRVNAHDFGHVLNNARIDFSNQENAKAYFDHFRSFLRGLMVFGAEAATNDPTWSIPLPFMSQLIHYFTSTGQSSKEKAADGWDRFEPSAVCKHLVESERVDEVSVRVFIDGVEVDYLYDTDLKLRRSVRLSDKTTRDLYVNIPTGLIGAHALYCILENVIRNGAKYGSGEGAQAGKLTLSIDLQTNLDKFDDLIRVRVWDDHSRLDPDPSKRSGFVKICSFFPPEISPVYLHKSPASDPGASAWRIIDDQGQLVSGGWGIKEMRITAGWLRQQRVVDSLSRSDVQPPLLKPIVVNECGQSVELNSTGRPASAEALYIGFEFYLLKPKDVLIIGGVEAIPDLATGMDAARSIEDAAERGTGHRLWLLNPADQEAMDKVMRCRQQVPPALVIRSRPGVVAPRGEVLVNGDWFNDVFDSLVPQHRMKAIQAAHRYWLREVLDAPESVALILQLSPSAGMFALSGVTKQWSEVSKFFGVSEMDGTEWYLDVGDDNIERRFGFTTFVYDYHAVWGTAHASELERELVYFYEPFKGTQPTQSLLFNPPIEEWARLRIVMGLIEAAVATVAVIDERIFNRCQSEATTGAWARARIHLPPDETFSYPSPTEEDFARLLVWFEENRIRVATIHQGVIDKAFSTKEGHINDWIKKAKSIVPILVVHSDRGEALLPRLPDDVRFVPYSSIEPWCSGEGTNKYFLVQTLLSARRRRVMDHGRAKAAGSDYAQ